MEKVGRASVLMATTSRNNLLHYYARLEEHVYTVTTAVVEREFLVLFLFTFPIVKYWMILSRERAPPTDRLGYIFFFLYPLTFGVVIWLLLLLQVAAVGVQDENKLRSTLENRVSKQLDPSQHPLGVIITRSSRVDRVESSEVNRFSNSFL